MSDRIFIGVAWPYASGPRHIGHAAGAYLPADVFARYHRMKGDDVLMVSGSDAHGTPITLAADREGITPQQIVERYHPLIKESFDRLGLSFDLYTQTHTENHIAVTQDVFLRLLEKGYLFRKTTTQPYDPTHGRFLPDRYVEGVCPVCSYEDARGDQCDNCGTILDPSDLISPRSKLSGVTPEFRDTEHFFLDLSMLSDQLLSWMQEKTYWRSNVLSFSRNWVREGLHARAITRDIEWGVPVPVPGYEDKRIYVWFEAVIGYLSASKEWAQRQGDPGAWERWWKLSEDGSPPARAYYFVGKDNIPFHTIIWPAMLLGYGGLTLPYDVPANEYLTMEDRKISTSRQFAVWLGDILDRYDADAVRYFMIANGPETRDTNFTWSEFYRRTNDELVATYGNLVHRVLTFTARNFDGTVPQPGTLSERDEQLLSASREAFRTVGDLVEQVRLKDGLREVMRLAQKGNVYLDESEPWKRIKTDRAAAATSLWVVLQVIAALRTLTQPFMPHSAQQLHRYLGQDGSAATLPWRYEPLEGDTVLGTPRPLFRKLDEEGLERELQTLMGE
ncbi:MAG: methionine--tRNA ligase [Chloroflexota bacterium]|nr:methionine--tRNA ligase [Chloroflexota bacterium]